MSLYAVVGPIPFIFPSVIASTQNAKIDELSHGELEVALERLRDQLR